MTNRRALSKGLTTRAIVRRI